ncbi:MAG: choice-of-anchor Q domain-containing protein [Terriglobales bacterium]
MTPSKKSLKTIFGVLAIVWFLTPLSVRAATITVTSTADSGPGSLRAAIASASPGDTINFSLAYPATITLSSTLSIGTSMTIGGPGASNLAISGNNSVQVLNIGGGITVTISGLSIQNGNNSAGNGGAISSSGTLMLGNTTLSGNAASFGGGIYIYQGSVTVTNSTLSGNSATDNGGGIYIYQGLLTTLTNSSLFGNSAASGGGGIFNYNGPLTLTNSTLSGNSASQGGGIDNYVDNNQGTMVVINSTFSGNSAASGGGINNDYGPLTLINSTLSGNSASQGGGINNYMGTATAKNNIIANNPSGRNCSGSTFISQGYNLSDDASCPFNQVGDVNNTPAGLDPGGLKNNGGPTQTIALLPTSPAVNAIPLNPTNYCIDLNGAPVGTDQRYLTRPQGSACDIGAYELIDPDDTKLAQLSGGNNFNGDQIVNGNVTASNFVGNGAGLTGIVATTANTATTATNALSLGGVSAGNYARLDVGNNFAANQAMPNITVSGTGNFGGPNYAGTAVTGTSSGLTGVTGNSSSGVGVGGASSSGYGVTGNSSTGVGVGGASTSGYGVAGNSQSSVGVGGASTSGYGVTGYSTNNTGILATTTSINATTAAAVFNNNATGNTGNILLGQYNGTNKFTVDAKGDVAASGSVAIGGGTPIAEHLSQTFSINVPSIAPDNCYRLAPLNLPGARDGDTIALGVQNALIGGLTYTYFAWVSYVDYVTIRVCNPHGANKLPGVSGVIRVDVWKH